MIHDMAVIDTLSGDDTLLDAVLLEVKTQCSEGKSAVDLLFNSRRGAQFSQIILKFTDVIEFNILYKAGDMPLDVWDLKFIQLKDDSFYITLDPDPATLGAAGTRVLDASDTDGFVIRASHVEAVVTQRTVP